MLILPAIVLAAGVASFADVLVQRDLAYERDFKVIAYLFATTLSKEVDLLCAVGTLEV